MGPVELARLTRAVRATVDTDEALALLPDNERGPYGYRRYGWTDGGCLVLADALVPMLGGRATLRAIVVPGWCNPSGRPIAQHFVAEADGWYLDAEGTDDYAGTLDRWAWMGRDDLAIKPVAVCAAHPETPRDADASARLAELISGRM